MIQRSTVDLSNLFSFRFSVKDQAQFAKRLSFLIRAGISIHESLTLISDQTESKRTKRRLGRIIESVSAGQFLSNSLDANRPLLSDFSVSIIRVGEHTGTLSENLAYLADELIKRQALRGKVLSALIYPFFVTLATLGVTSMLLVFIFPKIMPLFNSLNIELPFTTELLLTVSIFLKQWWFLTLAALFGSAGLFLLAYTAWAPLHLIVDRVLLHVPFLGSIIKAYNAANFCRTLRLTLHAGISLMDGLNIASDTTGNHVYKNAFQHATHSVLRGQKISSSLSQYKSLFPVFLPQMVSVGETTGSLPETLGYLSDLYEAEINERLKNLSDSVEPVLLIFMGILVGTIAVSIIAPIYEITRHLQTS